MRNFFEILCFILNLQVVFVFDSITYVYMCFNIKISVIFPIPILLLKIVPQEDMAGLSSSVANVRNMMLGHLTN